MRANQWERAISRSERGEVGKVYFVNWKLTWKDGREWTRHTQVTLNPDQGSTIELMLQRAKEIPKGIKSQLLSQRRAVAKLSNGNTLEMWIADEPAPEFWGIHQEKNGAILFDQFGQTLRS